MALAALTSYAGVLAWCRAVHGRTGIVAPADEVGLATLLSYGDVVSPPSPGLWLGAKHWGRISPFGQLFLDHRQFRA